MSVLTIGAIIINSILLKLGSGHSPLFTAFIIRETGDMSGTMEGGGGVQS